ncbi:MAG: hypothetical protein Q4B58_04765, partial [Bacteroidales bacterium]|nr:hypothetical protein [Bacteroidales bacterium]
LMALALVLGGTGLFTSCSEDNDPFITATEDDYPRILQPWFGEWENGVPPVYKTITRDMTYVDSVTVTPALYTTVKWFIDSVEVETGKCISKQLLAGEYLLQIVATTTKGLSTSRTGILVVNALPEDPALATDIKSRWFNPGKTKTIEGANLEKVTAVLIGDELAEDFVNNGSSLTFTVPANVPVGEQKIILGEGTDLYGCGVANVTNEEWVEPGIQQITLWSGAQVANWGDANVFLSAEEIAQVPVGTAICLEFNFPAADYYALRITNSDWSYDFVSQIDEMHLAYPDGNFAFAYTADMAANSANGMLFTGFGYELTRVYYEVEAAPTSLVFFEGEYEMPDWALQDFCNVAIVGAINDGQITAGKKIVVEGARTAADYCAVSLLNKDWMSLFNGKYDPEREDKEFDENNTPIELELTDERIQWIKEGGFYFAGHGYKVTKVSVL